MPIYLDAVGNTQALNTVTVRPQVGGQIVKIAFSEGQDVKRGDVLAEIDPRTYQAQYDQAVAKKAQDEATLANARIDLDRYTRLAASNSGSKQQADTQKALVAQLEAQVQGDQAAIDNARTMLSYTKIIAPIDGRTGLRHGRRRQSGAGERHQRHRGDHADPADLGAVQPAAAAVPAGEQGLRARARCRSMRWRPTARRSLDRGTLQVIDNQMDQTTGTIRMKAEFPNAQPAALARAVRQHPRAGRYLEAGRRGADRRRCSAGRNGTFVYVVEADSKVAVRPVTVAQQDDTRAVISGRPEGGGAGGHHRLHAAVQRHARAVQAGEGEPSRGACATRRAAPTAAAARRPPQARRRGRRERQRRQGAPPLGEHAPATPSTKQ